VKDRTALELRKDRRAEIITAALLSIGAAIETFRPTGTSQGRAHRAWLAAVPVVIVNYVAFRAQLRFWQAHLDRTDALLVALALESIAIYLAWLANLALVADDSALRLRLAAYGTALVIGVLNYSHYMKPGWKPTVAAVTFGMMSVISPWLWTAYSRRVSRPVLKAKRLIEDHAVRLGANRWVYHAYRCVRVMRAATWKGENRIEEAIQLVYPDTPGPDRSARGKPAARKTPPSAPPTREPRPEAAAAADGRAKARGRGLTAARIEAEAELVDELIQAGLPLPRQRQLARSLADHQILGADNSDMTRRRIARSVLARAAAGLDGRDVRDRA
jgi:hypothetical protein